MVPLFYEVSNAERSEEELTALRQVRCTHSFALPCTMVRRAASLFTSCAWPASTWHQSHDMFVLPAICIPAGGVGRASHGTHSAVLS